jgi:hypothetical protein
MQLATLIIQVTNLIISVTLIYVFLTRKNG